MEVVGYIFRILSHHDPFNINYFVVEYFLIVVVSLSRIFPSQIYYHASNKGVHGRVFRPQ